jgi:hypothetical protein
MKPGNAPLKLIRLLDQIRKRSRYLYCSLSAEKVYQRWMKFIVRSHGSDGRTKHPRDMGARENFKNRCFLCVFPASGAENTGNCIDLMQRIEAPCCRCY